MKKKTYTKEDFETGKIAIHTPKKRMYNKLMSRLEEAGFNVKHRWVGELVSVFGSFNKNTTVCATSHTELYFNTKQAMKDLGCTIIKPHQINLVEEKEMKSKYITTHAELLKLHGKKVTCKIEGEFIEDARIVIGKQGLGASDKELICVCCSINKDIGIAFPTELLGYDKAYWISQTGHKYEQDNKECTEIQLVEDKIKYTIEDLKTKKIAVHLPTQELWYRGIEFFEKNGITWWTGKKLSERNAFGKHKEQTCIAFNEVGMCYADCKCFRQEGYKIITLDQLAMEEETTVALEWEDEGFAIDLSKQGVGCLEQNLTAVLSDEYPKVIVKCGDKEKVITREDFKEEEEEKPKTVSFINAIEQGHYFNVWNGEETILVDYRTILETIKVTEFVDKVTKNKQVEIIKEQNGS